MSKDKARVRETRNLEPSGRAIAGKTLTRVVEIDGDPKEGQEPVSAETPLTDWTEEKE